MWSNTDVKPAKTFGGITKHKNFDLFGAQNSPVYWAFKVLIVHISASSSNEPIKQDYCESRGSFLARYSKTRILTHLEAQNGPKIWTSGAYIFTHQPK